MKLLEVIKEIQEENMSKDRLESYHSRLSSYLSELSIYRATLEKEEALFMGGKSPDETVASRKVSWKASSSGQKLLGVKGEIEAVKPLISSVKSRLYNFL
jgi:hypothetical protein